MAVVVAGAQVTGDILYNVKKVIIEELDPATGDVKTGTGSKYTISSDSEVGLEPEINEGDKKVLRDSTSIMAQVKDEDLLEAMNLKLTTCKFPVGVLPIIQGGSLKMDTTDVTKIVGYDAPTMAQGATQKKYFKLTIYVENRNGDDIVNYVKFTFSKCRGKILKLQFKKEFFAPEFEVRATENTKLAKPVYGFDYVDTLPV